MTWTPPPPCRIDLKGEHFGNAYPEGQEFRVTLVAETEDEWRITTETADGTVIDQMVLGARDANQVRQAASTAMRWPVPGLYAEPSWRLALDSHVYYVRLDSGHLDEVSAWLECWSGEFQWDPANKEWEF